MDNKNYLFLMAVFISRLLDIYIVFPIIIFICFFYSAGELHQRGIWAIVFLIILVAIPVLGDLYLTFKKKIVDWDLSIRKQRVKYLYIDTFLLLGLSLVSYLMNAPLLFRVTALIICIIEFIYSVFTQYWKISVHAQLSTLLSVYLLVFVGFKAIPIIICLPLIFFSRIYLKKHTYNQLLVGYAVSAFISLVLLKLFGYY